MSRYSNLKGEAPLTQRQFATLIGKSPRQVRRMIQDGTLSEPLTAHSVAELLDSYRARLTVAESLCRRFMPGELEARAGKERLA